MDWVAVFTEMCCNDSVGWFAHAKKAANRDRSKKGVIIPGLNEFFLQGPSLGEEGRRRSPPPVDRKFAGSSSFHISAAKPAARVS